MSLTRASMPLAASIFALLVGCGGSAAPPDAPPEPPPAPAPEAPSASEASPPAAAAGAAEPEAKPANGALEIAIEGRSKSSLTGTATFSEEGDGVKVVLKIGNAPPG